MIGGVNVPGASAVEIAAIKAIAEGAKETADAAMDAVQKAAHTITAVPSQAGTLAYTGSEQSPSWNNYNPDQLTLGGTTAGTNAGSYQATFTPAGEYVWADETQNAVTVTWSIEKAAISSTPAQSGTLTYSGSAQSPTWSNYDSTKLTLGGTTSGTDAGSYDATFTPKKNYQWADGTSTARTVAWNIGKAAGSMTLSKNTVSLSGAIGVSDTVTVTRAGDGEVSAVSSDTSKVTVSVSGTTVTIIGVGDGSATVSISVGAGTNYEATSAQIVSVGVALPKVFGVCWNMSLSSTALSRLTATNDPNSLATVTISSEPSPATGTGAGSSPFDSYAPWSGMDEYNISNSTVGAKKGESGFSRSSNDVVVYIPEFWFKIINDSSNSKRYFYISDKERDGFTKHPGSGRYVGRYNTASGNVSQTGKAPLVNITRATARSGAKGKGTGWYEYDYASWCAVWLLYLVEFADWDSQTCIGRGYCDSNSSAISSGGTDSMNYHTGRASGTDGKTAVQYRHIENPWGNVYEWIDGVNFSGGTVYACTDPTKYADDTATGYTEVGTKVQSNGYIKSLGFSTESSYTWTFFPTAVGGSETTYIPDYAYCSSGWRVLRVGGYWYSGSKAGLFYFYADSSSSNSDSNIGARLLFIP